jgi:hypothetical protein
MTGTSTITLPGTAHGKIEGDFVFLTKRVRIPRGDILAVKPSRDGEGATVITERGAMRVCEDYSALMYHLYGADVPNPGAHVGANVGAEIDRATNGGAR